MVQQHTHTEGGLVPAGRIMKELNYTDRQSFWAMVKKSNIPRYQIGERKILFDLEEVRQWIARRRIGGNQ